jgi:hypothetical protein
MRDIQDKIANLISRRSRTCEIYIGSAISRRRAGPHLQHEGVVTAVRPPQRLCRLRQVPPRRRQPASLPISFIAAAATAGFRQAHLELSQHRQLRGTGGGCVGGGRASRIPIRI